MNVHCKGEIDQDAAGPEFFDESTGRDCKLIIEGPHQRWIVFRGECGRWLPYRKATRSDLLKITDMMFDRTLARLA